MISIEERLKGAKSKVQEAQTKKVQLETRLQAAQERKQEVIDELATRKITPEELPEAIETLGEVIESQLQAIERILSGEKEERADSGGKELVFDNGLPF